MKCETIISLVVLINPRINPWVNENEYASLNCFSEEVLWTTFT